VNKFVTSQPTFPKRNSYGRLVKIEDLKRAEDHSIIISISIIICFIVAETLPTSCHLLWQRENLELVMERRVTLLLQVKCLGLMHTKFTET